MKYETPFNVGDPVEFEIPAKNPLDPPVTVIGTIKEIGMYIYADYVEDGRRCGRSFDTTEALRPAKQVTMTYAELLEKLGLPPGIEVLIKTE